ncbi:pyridoxamine 5'-phosphate oxidase family protein [Massilia sp. TSP1-1-2]|uniref:pyridoxamine 5'-phosphate oxidase family protein n=1 Tax=Massilia sp. TSP1-1-2 TaxID=2804649 RepID=UPI003CEEBEF1
MTPLDSHHRTLALRILARARDLTLASLRSDGAPHATTVSFASDELVMYAAIGIDSQKAHNIGADARVALTVNAPYQDWSEIQGMAIDAVAEIVSEQAQVRRAGELLLARFPQYAKFVANTGTVPWPGMLYIRIVPHSLSILDYAKGFGHTTHFSV